MNYLLDTSTCSFLMAHDPYVTAHFDSLSDLNDYLFTCTIVKGEILFGGFLNLKQNGYQSMLYLTVVFIVSVLFFSIQLTTIAKSVSISEPAPSANCRARNLSP